MLREAPGPPTPRAASWEPRRCVERVPALTAPRVVGPVLGARLFRPGEQRPASLSTQDLDPPAGAAHGAGGRRAGPRQRGDGEGVTWGGQARGEAPSSQTRPCRAASRRSEERRRELPRSGTAASLRGHQAGSETPGEPTAALSTPGREGRLPCRRTGYSEEGRVLGRYGATDGKSRSRTERVHRPRWSETRGR